MSRWDELTMAEKAEMMKVAIQNGITSLPEIRAKYNEFAGGGSTSSDADLIDWIIREEGFNTKPEDIGDGKITLGSGLTASKWHDLYRQRGNKWSASDNRKAVSEEVANRRRWAERNIPNWNKLPDSSQKALLAYKYNYDFTRNNSPKLFAALEKGDLYEAAHQMDATSKDPKFKKGLANRRKREQNWFLSEVPAMPTATNTAIYEQPVSTTVYTPYPMHLENTQVMPIMVPDEDRYVTTHEVSPSEQRAQKLQEAFEARSRFNNLMNLISLVNNPQPQYTPSTGNVFLDALGLFNNNAHGGKIHIKPENRGKFTALKERTGHSATWFKEHGTPAQRKMATFALNAKHWKHGLGGNLFDGTTEDTQQMQIGTGYWNSQPTLQEDMTAYRQQRQEEARKTLARVQQSRARQVAEKRASDYLTASNDNTWVDNNLTHKPKNVHLTDRTVEGAKQWAANDKIFREKHPILAKIGDAAQFTPLVLSTAPITVPIGDALAGTALGQLATKVLMHPISEAIGTSIVGGHGLSDLFKGNADAFTALELTPLAFPYGNFAKGANEALNYIGNKIPTPIIDAWNNRAEKTAMFFGKEGKTWTKVTDSKGKEGTVFLDGNDVMKGVADWTLHPIQTYRNWSKGFYPMTKKGWRSYLRKERDAMDFAKEKSIELNDAQLQQRLSLQNESFLDNKVRNAPADQGGSTIKIVDNPDNIFSWPRAPRNASEVANNVRVISRDKDVSYGGKWFDSKFGTGTAAVSHPDKNVIVLPRHDQTKFSNMLITMPSRGYTSPIDTRIHSYVHELQHQMQQNLPLLNLSQFNETTKYWEPYDHFLRNIDSDNLLQPFKDRAQNYPGSWLASPNEYNAESNAYRVLDDYKKRRNILEPLDETSASRLNPFGVNFDQIESLWDMGYKNGGKLVIKR